MLLTGVRCLYLVTAQRERHAAFKCNWRRVVDYPNLLRDLYQVSGIAETVHMDHIKRHYYGSHKQRNPTDIVPVGPVWQ